MRRGHRPVAETSRLMQGESPGRHGGSESAGRCPAVQPADGQSLFREAVKVVLGTESGFEVVAEASDGLEAVAEAERTRPHVALVDLNLPNCDGVRATFLITERVPDCRVVVLADDEDESVLINAVEAG